MTIFAVLAITLGAALACFFILWLISLAIRDVSIVDPYWGPGCAVLAGIALALAPIRPLAAFVVLGMVVAWSARLGIHLLIRKRAEPHEDARYAAMRKSGGPNFAMNSLWMIFGLQAVLQWAIALPVILAIARPEPASPALLGTGVLVFAIGLAFETAGDWQLTQFKAKRKGEDEVLDTGVWAWSRHPNYFGEATLWWGLFIASYASGAPIWTVISPILITFLLLRVSGVTMLETGMKKRKPAYADYVKRTSAFIPWPPKRPDAATK